MNWMIVVVDYSDTFLDYVNSHICTFSLITLTLGKRRVAGVSPSAFFIELNVLTKMRSNQYFIQ